MAKQPFLLRYRESEKLCNTPPNASKERRESNPKEEAPPKEPTKKTPRGD